MIKKRAIGITSALTGMTLLAGMAVPAAQASTLPPVRVIAVENGAFNTRNFNPFSGGVLSDTQGMEYQPFFYFNSTANDKPIPLLGTSYSWSKDAKTLTVQIRQGVKWSDGKPFTVKDVLYTYNTLLKKYPSFDNEQVMKHVSSVTAPNSHEVQFHFKQVNTTYDVYALSVYIVPQHIWAKQKGDLSKWTDPNPIGTGPFVLSSFTPQAFFYKPNKLYWNGAPKVPSVEFPAYNGNDSADLALADGLVDYAGLFVPNIQGIWAQKGDATNHYWYPAGAPTVLYPNLDNPLLANKAVRQAINIALNRDPLISQAEYGYPVPTNSVFLPPQSSGWLDPSISKDQLSLASNVAKAAQILESAGFKKGADGIYADSSGNKLAFDLDVPAGWTDWDESCSLMVQQMAQFGIQFTLKQLQWGDYSSILWPSNGKATKNPYLIMCWTNIGPSPIYEYQSVLHTGSFGYDNFEHYNNPVVDKALDDFSSTSNTTRQKKDIYTVEHAVLNDTPVIPLWNGPSWYEYSTKYYTGWPSADNPYVDPSPFTAVANAIVLANLKPNQ